MKMLLLLVCLATTTTTRADLTRDLSRLVGWRIVAASTVHGAAESKDGGYVVRLLNGQVWHAPFRLLQPLIAEDVIVLERNGDYRIIMDREVLEARLIRGTLTAERRDEHGLTADVYDRLARKLDADGDKQGAALARARAAKLR